ncbi:C4-dicarboxylate TRAP transporter substrate-binding protein [Marinibaculum pumilum]|uniref:C4-dicarboxylate TRAP transporter substrate-binding protein n=1 Tax=Marinibaculum pumilum TaxID=1766165 RepID=A0ABV7L495_9PROT
MQLKRMTQLGLAAGMAAGLVAAAGLTPALAKEFTYSTFISPKSTNNTEGVEPMFERVKAATNGEMDWKLYPAGQILAARSTLPGVRDGVADAGFVVAAYHPSELKNTLVLANMINSGSNAIAVAGAVNEAIMLGCKECQDDFRAQNSLYLGGHVTTSYYPMCAKKFDGLEGFKGLKIKATGAFSGILQELGAVPVNIPTDEMAEAMERGQIDCVLGSLAWMENYSLKDVTNYVLEAPFGSTRGLGLMTVNKDVWEGLPADQRKALLDNMGGMISGAVHGYLEQDAEAKKNALAKGVVFEQPSAAFSAALEPSPKFKQENLDKAASLGVKDPQKIADSFNAILPKWQKIAEEVGMDKDAYAKALQREIYDKVDY